MHELYTAHGPPDGLMRYLVHKYTINPASQQEDAADHKTPHAFTDPITIIKIYVKVVAQTKQFLKN